MTAKLDPDRLTSRPEDRLAPYWPVLHYLYDDEEIIATLYWDDEELDGFDVEPDGTLGDEVESQDEPTGWCVAVHALTSPSMLDPREQVMDVLVLGDLPVAEALAEAAEIVARRARPTGCSHEESRERLIWKTV